MKKKNILFISVSLVLILLLGIGISYSMWNITTSQDTTNTAYTKCFDVSITNQKNSIDLENTYPISDEKGKKLTPFSFTITNTCDIFASYTVNLESLKDTTLNSKFLKVILNNEELKLLNDYESTDTVNTGSIESHILAKGSLGSGDSEDYTLRLWIDYDTTLDDLDNEPKTFKSKIVVKAQPSTWNPVKEGYTTLHDAILANEYQTSPEASIKKIEAKGTPDLSNTAPIIKWIEKTGENTIREVAKPAMSAIKSDEQTSDLTEDDTKIRVYRNMSFDANSGRYSLYNEEIVDPSELNYENNEYYFAAEEMEYNVETKKIYTSSGGGDGTYVYKIKNAQKTIGKTVWNNIEYDSITYKLNLSTLMSVESEVDKSDKGLYKDIDDYGTTYYYRGNVKNNNVYFSGAYWQIIRINGDDSIRLLYNGTNKDATGSEKSITTAKFNNTANNPTYVGYMYGNPNGTTYNEIHNNKTSSNIKNIIDEWYLKNIEDKNLDKYISYNTGFCGDRSLNSGNGISLNESTSFSANNRLSNSKATFKCPNISNDLYTTSSSKFGNKSLTYPIALITSDELVYSGIDLNHVNKKSWSYSQTHYWTMTPSDYFAQQTSPHVIFSSMIGYLNPWNYVELSLNVRPVINLKSDVKITSGIGTVNEPFVIDTN